MSRTLLHYSRHSLVTRQKNPPAAKKQKKALYSFALMWVELKVACFVFF